MPANFRLSLNTGFANFGIGVGAGAGGAMGGGQQFATQPVPSATPALYQLAILTPDRQAFATYTFPISPAELRREYVSLNTSYLVQGPTDQAGVQRIIDQYGDAPFTFVISGTTGLKQHSTDGMGATGLQSIANLQSLLRQFAVFNQGEARQGNPLFILEFYDYYLGEFWEIVPVGPQGFRQSSSNGPALVSYAFRWEAVASLRGAPTPPPPGPFDQAFQMTAAQAATNLRINVGNTLGFYLHSTIRVG